MRVVTSSAFSLLTLTPLVDGFRKLYSKINVHLTLAERHIDLVEDGYYVGIVTAFMVSSTALVERPVGLNALVPVATPAFIAQHGLSAAPADLQNMSTVALPNDIRSSSWHFRHKLGSSDQVNLTPVYSVNSALMVLLATLRDMGFSILPEGIVANDIKDGTLVRLLPDYAVNDPEMKVSIVYPGRQYLPAKTHFFIDYALERLTREINSAGLKPDEIFRQQQAAFAPSSASSSSASVTATAH